MYGARNVAPQYSAQGAPTRLGDNSCGENPGIGPPCTRMEYAAVINSQHAMPVADATTNRDKQKLWNEFVQVWFQSVKAARFPTKEAIVVVAAAFAVVARNLLPLLV